MNKYSIDEIVNKYNNSEDECLDESGEFLKYGTYSIEEFIWWLKKEGYEFIN